ncbi:MAG: DksA/TraR family C4-type zinc finger protein [Granulosicoccus sp.]|nr:DksA/TraR family C4-type zinc finger protein [Granulosicoccus sp.]
MAGGWSKDGAVQDQIDASVAEAVNQARARLPDGESLSICEECEAEIPVARQQAVPGVRLCVACQQRADLDSAEGSSSINRRASKDSLLR